MEISLPVIKEEVARFLGRYHYLIFFVFIVSGLSVAIFVLNQTIIASDDADGYTSTTNTVQLDTATVDKLRELRSNDETSSQLDFGSDRISPF